MAVVSIDHERLAMPGGGEDAATAFYQGLLGVPRVPKPPHLEARGGCWFEQPGLKIHLGVDADFRPARKAHPALLVDNLASLVERLRAAEIDSFMGSPSWNSHSSSASMTQRCGIIGSYSLASPA